MENSSPNVTAPGANPPPATQTPRTRVDALKSVFNAKSVQEQFNNVLKENAPSFIASVIDLVNTNNTLQNCDPNLVVMEALKAAILKLPINKNLGFAFIVPYNKSVKTAEGWKKIPIPTMQIGYKGYIQLAMRTGQYRFLNADKVYEGEYVSSDKLTGEFDLSGKRKSDKVVGYFCHVQLLNGFSKTLYMTIEQVNEHASRYSASFSDDKSLWKTDFDAMATKTVIRRLLTHYGYLNIEMAAAFDMEGDSVSAQVKDEISRNGNKDEVGFTDYTEVKPGEGDGQQNGQQNGQQPDSQPEKMPWED